MRYVPQSELQFTRVLARVDLTRRLDYQVGGALVRRNRVS